MFCWDFLTLKGKKIINLTFSKYFFLLMENKILSKRVCLSVKVHHVCRVQVASRKPQAATENWSPQLKSFQPKLSKQNLPQQKLFFSDSPVSFPKYVVISKN